MDSAAGEANVKNGFACLVSRDALQLEELTTGEDILCFYTRHLFFERVSLLARPSRKKLSFTDKLVENPLNVSIVTAKKSGDEVSVNYKDLYHKKIYLQIRASGKD